MINNLHLKSRIYYLTNALLSVFLFTPVISLSGIVLSTPNCTNVLMAACLPGWMNPDYILLPTFLSMGSYLLFTITLHSFLPKNLHLAD